MDIIIFLLLVIIFLISPVAAGWIIGIFLVLWFFVALSDNDYSSIDAQKLQAIAEADKVNAPVDKVLFGVDFSKGFARLWPVWLAFFIFFMLLIVSYLLNL